jgi:NTP pyrophosphatase (non-canonical NTP hydrolase)
MIINMEPCWKYIGNALGKQINHIHEETHEVLDAIRESDFDSADMEVMDVIQSCVTYFNIRGYSQKTVDELAKTMHEKNDARHYYEKVTDK